jgi:transcriptional regulator with PAS, ATPase and Fis domain
MKGKWLKYEKETRLIGFLIVLILMVFNFSSVYLLNIVRRHYDTQFRAKMDFIAFLALEKISNQDVFDKDFPIANLQNLSDSAGLKEIGIIGDKGFWEFSTSTFRMQHRILAAPLENDPVVENLRKSPGKPFKIGNSWYISFIYSLKKGGGNLILVAPADFQAVMAYTEKTVNYGFLLIGILLFVFLYFYFNSIFSPFRTMAKNARENLPEKHDEFDSDVDLVMDVYHKMISELKDKGKKLGELYDSEKVRADNLENYSRQVLDSIDKGILTVNREGKLISYNKSAANILGEGRVDNLLELFPDIQKQHSIIKEYEKADRTRVTIQIDVSDFREQNGEIIGKNILISDITEARRNEELAGYTERAELINSAAQNLLNRISPVLEGLRDNIRGTICDKNVGFGLREIENCLNEYGNIIKLEKVESSEGFSPDIVYQSAVMNEVMQLTAKVAPSESTVLITGESGTGKELIAKEVHRLSNRAKGEFVALNCAALPENLLESELFGYIKGAFTGAGRDKPGLFKIADKGTFFLDEISELSLSLQAKILRAIQEREITPIGGTRPYKVDVRLIAATNRDLKELIEKGAFRQDLYYRINVFPINLPPLRERKDDFGPLVKHFIQKSSLKMNKQVAGISNDAMNVIYSNIWPGNVRQLENAIERAIIIASGLRIEASDLDFLDVPESVPDINAEIPGEGLLAVSAKAAAEAESTLIKKTLAETRGNKSEAARRLKISYRVMLKKIKDYGLEG